MFYCLDLLLADGVAEVRFLFCLGTAEDVLGVLLGFALALAGVPFFTEGKRVTAISVILEEET